MHDGRKLAYAEYGSPGGKPIFLFHGIPGSRLMRHPDDSIAGALNVRLIVLDRPGMGLSDFKLRGRLLDWSAEVLELAYALGIKRFAVAGFSGGGPYAAACGYALAPRLVAVGIISGTGPLDEPGVLKGILPSNRMGYRVGRWMPWRLWRLIFGFYYRGVRERPKN